MSLARVVVGTDVILGHLRGKRRPSLLRVAMGKYFCYTTVFNAIELFAIAKDGREKDAVEDAMATMKVLGLNAKTAGRYGTLIRRYPRKNRWDLLVAGMCIESKLPLMTMRRGVYRGIRGLSVLGPGDV